MLARQHEVVQAVGGAFARLGHRQRGGQADHALQQPAHVANALLVVPLVGHRVQRLPETLAQQGAHAQTPCEPLVALGERPGFGQPHGQAQVFRAGAQQGFAGAGHPRPVGHLEAGDPFTLVERGVIGAPHFVDGVKLRREGQIVAARRVCGQRRQQDFHFHDIPVCSSPVCARSAVGRRSPGIISRCPRGGDHPKRGQR